jgi:hypothetical protein
VVNELEGAKEAGERLIEAREELNDMEDQLKHSKALAKAVMQDPCSCEKNCSLGKCGKGKRPCTPHCGKGGGHLHICTNPHGCINSKGKLITFNKLPANRKKMQSDSEASSGVETEDESRTRKSRK